MDSADTIAAFASEMSEFLKTSELTETKAFVRSFVKEVLVRPGGATIVYTIPTPEDSAIGGADAAEIALNGGVRSIGYGGGAGVYRTKHGFGGFWGFIPHSFPHSVGGALARFSFPNSTTQHSLRSVSLARLREGMGFYYRLSQTNQPVP